MADDRTVHARCGDEELVRYDRAGKWFLEYRPARMRPARQVSVGEAVRLALEMIERGGSVIFRRPGGTTFDRKVRSKMEQPKEIGIE